MWQKLIELLLEKFIQPLTSAQRSERRAKRNLVFVHEALIRCHRYYLAYKESPIQERYSGWRSATLDLANCLNEARTVLATFDSTAYEQAVGYVYAECTAEPMDPKVQKRLELESCLQSAINALTPIIAREEPQWDEQLAVTAERVREVIKKHIEIGEIQRSQEAFSRKYPTVITCRKA